MNMCPYYIFHSPFCSLTLQFYFNRHHWFTPSSAASVPLPLTFSSFHWGFGLHPLPEPLCPHYHLPFFASLPGRMTSGKPSLRVSARALLNTAWFSRLICSSSPRSSCREIMSPGGRWGGRKVKLKAKGQWRKEVGEGRIRGVFTGH